MRRLPVRAGDSVYVPGGTLHRFGPETLIYEIEQASNIQQYAMPWHMEDGSAVPADERQANIEMLLQELRPDPRPEFHPGLRIAAADGMERTICCPRQQYCQASAQVRERVGHACA